MRPEIDAIKAREQAATKGPWFAYRTNSGWSVQIPQGWLFVASDKCQPEDVVFAANARQDVPKLVAEVERLCAENQRLTTENEDLQYRLDSTLMNWGN